MIYILLLPLAIAFVMYFFLIDWLKTDFLIKSTALLSGIYVVSVYKTAGVLFMYLFLTFVLSKLLGYKKDKKAERIARMEARLHKESEREAREYMRANHPEEMNAYLDKLVNNEIPPEEYFNYE